jgi:hypothetical protein
MYNLHHANVLEWAATYDGEPFHALITDPPYHLTSITDRFGRQGSAPAQFGRDGAFSRVSRGFMNAQWDGGDVAFRPETWAALAQHIYPGAFGMAFASTRGLHRMMVAIEDAGLIIHPIIFCWGFGSGFPKATRIDTTVDRVAGATRAVVGQKAQTGAKFKLTQELIGNGGFNDPDRDDYDVTAPATPLAAAWVGHRYGLQAMKPALEPIIVFQRPYVGKPVECITRTGAGALWIDGGRIPSDNIGKAGASPKVSEGWDRPWRHDPDAVARIAERKRVSNETAQELGRWPANLILSHTPRCDDDGCSNDCPVKRLGEQSGDSASKRSERGAVNVGTFGGTLQADREWKDNGQDRGFDDEGTAARFFYNATWTYERLENADPVVYVPKASTAEREAGLEGPVSNTHERMQIHLTRTHLNEVETWGLEGLKVALLVDTETSQPRVIGAFTTRHSDVSAWNTLLFGNESESLSPMDGKSITVTTTNLITESKTLSWWMRSLTNVCTADVKSEMGNGGNLAESVAHSIPYLTIINVQAVSIPGVGIVPAGTLWTISASAKLFERMPVNDGRITPIDNPYQRGETERFNIHATIKPISLIKHLATLLLPPAEYAPRRILVPFSGAGSEVIACHLAGWESITGIELEAAHVEIARHRLEWWTAAARATFTTEPDAILDKAGDKTTAQLSEQLTLFDIAA